MEETRKTDEIAPPDEGTFETGTIYHIAEAEDWARAQALDAYAGGADCRADGFIHFSTRDQVATTLARFFAGRDGLVLLSAEAAELGGGLRWEAASSGDMYPHYYGILPPARLRLLGSIGLGRDGGHVAPLDAG